MQRYPSWGTIFSDSPYTGGAASTILSGAISEKFSLSPDPSQWGSDLSPDIIEPDDDLHGAEIASLDYTNKRFSGRGLVNVGCLVFLLLAIVVLFAAYPIITFMMRKEQSSFGGFNIGGINATGQVPKMPGNWGLIDLDTPKEAYRKKSWRDNSELVLVFSDEFNTDGRTFYPGDDPYWEAVDLHYWATNNMEWYDPGAITTQGGSLVITFSQKETHDLHFQGGMMSTWNKFCFTGGLVETNVELPGVNNVVGLWPSLWTLGNLGRAGYGASLDGLWPYTYDSCDVGTIANQTMNGQPVAATVGGDKYHEDILSFLPGQRLSRCTCPGEDHPGPKHADGTFVGRSAPEIDVFEAQVRGDPLAGQVSQSAQWAPFNAGYIWYNTSQNEVIADPTISQQNDYIGGVTQQATSVVTEINQSCYEGESGCYSVYGFEYSPGFDNAYITWISNNVVAWTLNVAGMDADALVGIGPRPVSQEPMYLVANLGMSTNFGAVDFEHLTFPVHMRVDYVRVYQRKDRIDVGCDPERFPTREYIDRHIEVYTNPNLTTWTGDYGQLWPRNSFLGQC